MYYNTQYNYTPIHITIHPYTLLVAFLLPLLDAAAIQLLHVVVALKDFPLLQSPYQTPPSLLLLLLLFLYRVHRVYRVYRV